MRACLLLFLVACVDVTEPPVGEDGDVVDTVPPVELPEDTVEIVDSDPGDSDPPLDSAIPEEPGPFADRVVSFEPGEAAGFGADGMPGVVLGHPLGRGESAGSLDVVSLGRGGTIVLAFEDMELVDGPGPDLLVFENPFTGFYEPGEVAVSQDGETWHVWPCDALDVEGDFPGCAGVRPVHAHPDDQPYEITDARAAGGDAFDLEQLGLQWARFVRVRDAEAPTTWYQGTSGGFDLDAIAVVNGRLMP